MIRSALSQRVLISLLCLSPTCVFAQEGGESAAAERPVESKVTIAKEDFHGWANTYRIGNGQVEARIATDVGPRIVDLRPAGGDNVLMVRDKEAGKSGEKQWMFRGGWRLWVAPEKRET